MSIGTPNQIASVSYNQSSGTSLTTDADAPAGSLIWVLIWLNTGGNTGQSVTSVGPDSAGNTYSIAVQYAGLSGAHGAAIAYSSNTPNDLPSGGTIPIGCTASSSWSANAWTVSGANGGLDKTNTADSASAVTSASITTGTLTNTNEIVVAILNGAPGYPNFTGIVEGLSGTGLGDEYYYLGSYAIVSTTTSQTYAPSWSTPSTEWVSAIATFEVTPPILFSCNKTIFFM